MALTKTTTVVANSITMTAGAGNVTSGADTDLSTYYKVGVAILFTNGGTAPTIAPQVEVQICETSGGTYIDVATVTGGLVNSGLTPYYVPLPDETKFYQIVSGSNTGQAVTLRAVLYGITAY